MAYAEDGMVLQADRSVVAHGQPRCLTWRAASGLTLNVTTTHIRPTVAGAQPGLDLLGFHLRQ